MYEHIVASLIHPLQYLKAFDQVLTHTVTGDQTWAHHYSLESKAKSVSLKYLISSTTKKFKFIPIVGKVLETLFWDISDIWDIPVGVHAMWELSHISGKSYINKWRNLL
jgi:hypothetical protein